MIFSLPKQSQVHRVSVSEIPEHLNWLAMALRLANDIPTKLKEVYEMNYTECLTILSYWYYRDKQINDINKQQELKNKIR